MDTLSWHDYYIQICGGEFPCTWDDTHNADVPYYLKHQLRTVRNLLKEAEIYSDEVRINQYKHLIEELELLIKKEKRKRDERKRNIR